MTDTATFLPDLSSAHAAAEHEARAAECRVCGAAPGEPCIAGQGEQRRVAHALRYVRHFRDCPCLDCTIRDNRLTIGGAPW